MRCKRAHTLSPLTKICSMKVKFKWTDVEINVFIAAKKIEGYDVVLSYPNFSESFIIDTNTSRTQFGEVVSQNGKSIAIYSRKLTLAQINYTKIEV